MARHSSENRGFTLVELLVVIAIVALLVGLLLPAVQAAREATRLTRCVNNLRQIGLALLNYESATEVFPPTYSSRRRWSWLTAILPFAEEKALFNQLELDEPHGASVNASLVRTPVPAFQCASDGKSENVSKQGYAFTNYLGLIGARIPDNNGMFEYWVPSAGSGNWLPKPIKLRQVTDGTSKTICVGERPVVEDDGPSQEVGRWVVGMWAESVLPAHRGLTKPDDILRPKEHYWSYHPVGANFVFLDNSVRLLSFEMADDVFYALATRNGGEPINVNDL